VEEIAKLVRGASVDDKDELYVMKHEKTDDFKMNSCRLAQT
jgi:hypothetical protein